MGLLDQVSQMKKEGMSNEEITLKLQEQGISPRTINDVFNQEKIKNAVSSEEQDSFEEYTQRNPQTPALSQAPPALTQKTFYQPKTQEVEQTEEEYYNPAEMTSPQEYYSPEMQGFQPPEAPQSEEYYPQEQMAYAQPYEGGSYAQAGGYTADTIIEIAEQVFSEKIKKIERQIEQFNEFINISQTRINNDSERIKRIETIIDKLQIAILEKIGSYGQNIEGIKKEMEMIEDSFAKIVPQLHKKAAEHKKAAKKSEK